MPAPPSQSIDEAMPTPAAMHAARRTIAAQLKPTRLIATSRIEIPGGPVLLKLESELPTGSFKVRGALVGLACWLERGPLEEVVASSTGNHGAAVAWAARVLGVRATIFVPRNANPIKRANILKLGATLVEKGRDISEAADAARAYASQKRGVHFLNDANDPHVVAGTATIALELLEQDPDVETIVVPVGDSALIRGVAAAVRHVKPGARIIGVQAVRAPAYTLSWRSGSVVSTDTCDTVADGLATREPLAANVAALRVLVDDMVLVSEDEMLRSVASLLLEEHVIAEPSGAAALAALLRMPHGDRGRTALIVSGGNLSRETLRMALDTTGGAA